MSDNPFDEDDSSTNEPVVSTTTPGPWGGNPLDVPVNITLKAGKGYEAPWIGIPNIPLHAALDLFDQHSKDISKLMSEVAGASQEFQKQAKRFGVDLPPKGSYGKPAGASTPPPPADDPQDAPFDTPEDKPKEESPMMGCEHGVRKLVEHGGKRGHVCPLPKGNPERCATIFE